MFRKRLMVIGIMACSLTLAGCGAGLSGDSSDQGAIVIQGKKDTDAAGDENVNIDPGMSYVGDNGSGSDNLAPAEADDSDSQSAASDTASGAVSGEDVDVAVTEKTAEELAGMMETTGEKTLREQHQVVGTMSQETGGSRFWVAMNHSEYNFFNDETYEYQNLGVGKNVDFSSLPNQAIINIAMEVIDDNGYNSVLYGSIGNDKNDVVGYLVFDGTYYLETVYNDDEQGAYAILACYDLPDGTQTVPGKYSPKTNDSENIAAADIESTGIFGDEESQ